MITDIRTSICEETRCEALRAMIAQEEVESYRVCDYLKSYEKCKDKGNDRDDGRCPLLNSTSRMSICEWMYRVVDYFGIDREGECLNRIGQHCLTTLHEHVLTSMLLDGHCLY